MQTSDRTRGVALLVPRLLSIQADPAEHETSDALADAIERAAEALLGWHDEIAEMVPPRGPGPAGSIEPATEAPEERAHASELLAAQVRRGVIPADPASLEAAASELRSIGYAVERVAAGCTHDSTQLRGNEIARALTDLSDALRALADTLRTEARRLVNDGAAEASQVLGRVVRAEHAVRRVAAATLRV